MESMHSLKQRGHTQYLMLSVTHDLAEEGSICEPERGYTFFERERLKMKTEDMKWDLPSEPHSSVSFPISQLVLMKGSQSFTYPSHTFIML